MADTTTDEIIEISVKDIAEDHRLVELRRAPIVTGQGVDDLREALFAKLTYAHALITAVDPDGGLIIADIALKVEIGNVGGKRWRTFRSLKLGPWLVAAVDSCDWLRALSLKDKIRHGLLLPEGTWPGVQPDGFRLRVERLGNLTYLRLAPAFTLPHKQGASMAVATGSSDEPSDQALQQLYNERSPDERERIDAYARRTCATTSLDQDQARLDAIREFRDGALG